MTTQTKDRARSANDHDTDTDTVARTADGFEAATDLTEQAREKAVESTRQIQDSVLGVVRVGQNATLALVGMWTEAVRRPGPFGVGPDRARAAVSGGYDMFEQLLASQRRFVDGLIAEQRRFVEAVLTPRGERLDTPRR